MKATVYVHGSKEDVWHIGERLLGLTGEALSMFSHCVDQVKLTLAVSKKTGRATIMLVDDRPVSK